VWSQIDGHDARSVITADFFVTRETVPSVPSTSSATSYAVVQDLPDDPTCAGCDEPMVADRRAGMITSRWFLSYFVMFTPLPRAAAAQAYRAFLGVDIAKNEGLFPITVANGYPEDEPKDYDAKGVMEPACAACHSTLDPLMYAYRNYNGLTGQNGAGRAKYVPGRLELIWDDPLMNQTPESGYILGQPYTDLTEWVQIAANSDQFAIAALRDYWRILIGRDPLAAEAEEFDQLWQDFKTTHAYSVEKMLHDFVRTEAYGAP
jgi:hypothetical protein